MNVLSLFSLLNLLNFWLQFRLFTLLLHCSLYLHFLNGLSLRLFLLFFLQLFSLLLLACLFSEEAALFDSGRSGETEAPSQFGHVDLVSPKDLLEKTGSEVIDIAAISIEALPVEIITLLHELAQLIIDAYKLALRKLHEFALDTSSLLDHIQVFLVDFE
jgi:hypothetical protein